MKIYNSKKSPKLVSPSKYSEESVRLKKHSPIPYKFNEKSYFLPDISKKGEHFKRKKSTKFLPKVAEIQTDAKYSLISNDAMQSNDKSRNPSLAHDFSIDNIVKSSYAIPILSNRHQSQHKKDLAHYSPDQLLNISFLPVKYKLKRYENLKGTNSRSNIMSFNNFTPSHK